MRVILEHDVKNKCEGGTDSEESLKQETDIEDVLRDLKISGRYHIRFLALMCFLLLINSGNPINYVFVAEKVNYRCIHPNCTYSDLLQIENSSNLTLDFKCHKYELLGEGTCTADNIDMSSIQDCTEWEYEDPNSFVAEFNLGCKDLKRSFVGTMHSAGYMIGLFLMGPLSDNYVCNLK